MNRIWICLCSNEFELTINLFYYMYYQYTLYDVFLPKEYSTLCQFTNWTFVCGSMRFSPRKLRVCMPPEPQ